MININESNTRELADSYNKRHSDILDCIRNMIRRNPELQHHFTERTYLSNRGKHYPEYIFDDTGYEIITHKLKYNVRNARFEVKFYNELYDYLKEYNYEIIPQFSVCDNRYRIDYYIPEINLAIEYDEYEHKFKKQDDIKREEEIHNEIGCEFIRFQEDSTIGKSLAIIHKYIDCCYRKIA